MIDDEEIYDYLEHFGVKGMRWGIRNASGSMGIVVAAQIMKNDGARSTSSIKLPDTMNLDDLFSKETTQVKMSSLNYKSKVTPKYKKVVSKKRILAS